MDELITVSVQVLPAGNDFPVELSIYTTGEELVEELINAGEAPGVNTNGNPVIYELFSKEGEIPLEKSMRDMSVKDGDMLRLVPKVVAG